VESALWEKAAFICAQAGMTASVRLPIGEIRSTEASWRMFRRLVEEVVAVGEAAGVDLPEGLPERWTGFAEELEGDSYSSLHYDLTSGKPMELEALHGEVVRTAREHGVDAPMHEAVYAVLAPWAERTARQG
jgi:2-dehydropantoate 2-reductase